MKKLIIVCFLIMLTFPLLMISNNNVVNSAQEEKFTIEDRQYLKNYKYEVLVIEDTVYGKEYILVTHENGIAITPRLKNEDNKKLLIEIDQNNSEENPQTIDANQ